MLKYSVWKLAVVSHCFRVRGNAGINDTCIPNEEETKLFRSKPRLSGVVLMDHQALITPDFVPDCWSVNWLDAPPDSHFRQVDKSVAVGWFLQPSQPHMCPLISISQPHRIGAPLLLTISGVVNATTPWSFFDLNCGVESSGIIFIHLPYFVRIPRLAIKQMKILDWSNLESSWTEETVTTRVALELFGAF